MQSYVLRATYLRGNVYIGKQTYINRDKYFYIIPKIMADKEIKY